MLRSAVGEGLLRSGLLLGAVQRAAGWDEAPRSLLPSELAIAGAVFRGALSLERVRVRPGVGGLFSLPPRVSAFVLGHTVFVLRRGAPPPGGALPGGLLVHELVHCWQYEHGGTSYIPRALAAQAWGEGYDFVRACAAGRPWSALNPEQQASLVEAGYRAGALEGERPFVVAGRDLSGALAEAVRALRAGEGAPT
ncbi:MAG: hypothetical protein RL653_2150 [Pseudomonadota bacterium]